MLGYLKALVERHEPHGSPDYERGFNNCKQSILATIDHVQSQTDAEVMDAKDAEIAQLQCDRDHAMFRVHQLTAYHETEKSMRQFAEQDLSKFKKIFGRLHWQKK